MFEHKLLLLGAALLLSSSAWAQTNAYYGGFEDTVGSDYDYNDLVFSLSGSLLSSNSSGSWYSEPTPYTGTQTGLNHSPFWNNGSSDGSGSGYNVGFCIYGGGNCGSGLAPNALYLAANNSSTTGSANDVVFSVSGSVTETVNISITADNDALGWEAIDGPNAGVQHFFSAGDQSVTFTPGGDFILLGQVNGSTVFSSDPAAGYGMSDTVSHFAFFTPVPEPASISLFGLVLAGAAYARKRKAARSL